MGSWGVLAFDNDAASDWAYDLETTDGFLFIESTLDKVAAVGDGYLDADTACAALAACEVLARLQGHYGYKNSYTGKVDKWVAEHPLQPSAVLLRMASAAIDRILGQNSELRELWNESDGDAWRSAVENLRQRVNG